MTDMVSGVATEKNKAEKPAFKFVWLFYIILGLFLLGETLRPNVAIGAAIVVAAGLFTLWRAKQKT